MATKKPKKAATATTRINFEAQLFRKKDLPANLKTAKGRTENGIWGMQELHLDGEDFTVAFGRTWSGAVANVAKAGAKATVKKSIAKKAVAKKAVAKKAANK